MVLSPFPNPILSASQLSISGALYPTSRDVFPVILSAHASSLLCRTTRLLAPAMVRKSFEKCRTPALLTIPRCRVPRLCFAKGRTVLLGFKRIRKLTNICSFYAYKVYRSAYSLFVNPASKIENLMHYCVVGTIRIYRLLVAAAVRLIILSLSHLRRQ